MSKYGVFSGPYYPVFGLNTGKYGPGKTPSLDTFHAVVCVTINPLNASPTKRSNTFKKFVGNLPTNCLSVFDHFAGLGLKGLMQKCHRGTDATESIDWN